MLPGKLIVISAPSGAGKTTIAHHLLQSIPVLSFSVSATTRPRRQGETDGVDYFFITPQDFQSRIERHEFIEWEQVYRGIYYGTLTHEVMRLWQHGKTVLFDVDVTGALNLKSKFPEQALTIFIKPPSFETLVSRLKSRATDTPEKIEERINKARTELLLEPRFDAVILNDDLQHAKNQAEQLTRKFIGLQE